MPSLSAPATNEPEAELVGQTQVAARLGISTVTLWRWVKAGRIAQPIRLSRSKTGWRRADIDALFAAGGKA